MGGTWTNLQSVLSLLQVNFYTDADRRPGHSFLVLCHEEIVISNLAS